MKNKKIISLLGLLTLSLSLMVSCDTNKEIQPDSNNIAIEVPVEDRLSGYTEEGVQILKNNYTTTADMEFALKNIGMKISDMKFMTYSGKEIGIKDFKGEKLILEISQASCESCKEAEPIVHNAMKNSDIKLIPVFLNSTKEDIDMYYSQLNLEKPETIIIDTDKVTKDKFSLSVTPTYIYVDESGIVSLIKQEFIDETSFKEDINLAFGETKLYDYIIQE